MSILCTGQIQKSELLFENQKRLLLRNTQNDVIETCDLTLLMQLVGFLSAPNTSMSIVAECISAHLAWVRRGAGGQGERDGEV